VTFTELWRLLLVGLTLLLAGCAHPLEAAVATSNTAAHVLKATHGQMAKAYGAEQVAAARAVEGDRELPQTKDAQRAAVATVRETWGGAWRAYRLARASWVELVVFLEVAIAVGNGTPLDPIEALTLVRELVTAQREMLVAAEPFVDVLSITPSLEPAHAP
jgi:hypothetical protein